MSGFAVGKALSHESAALHVTGRATYVEDLATRSANVAYAWPIPSHRNRGGSNRGMLIPKTIPKVIPRMIR